MLKALVRAIHPNHHIDLDGDGKVSKEEAGAIDLVQRSRVGDQNAVAMLIMIKKSAQQGSDKAKRVLKLIEKYIANNSVPDWSGCIGFGCSPATQLIINRFHSTMGSEPQHYAQTVISEVPRIDPFHAAVPLSNVGDLLYDRNGQIARTHDANPRIRKILQKYPNVESRTAFIYGLNSSNLPMKKLKPQSKYSDEALTALHIGRSVGIARRIQSVRLPDVPISVISKMAAWELGE
jgi:hypothetical protein